MTTDPHTIEARASLDRLNQALTDAGLQFHLAGFAMVEGRAYPTFTVQMTAPQAELLADALSPTLSELTTSTAAMKLADLIDEEGLELGVALELFAGRRTPEDLAIIQRARELYDEDDVVVDEAALVAEGDHGSNVMAWVWVPEPDEPPAVQFSIEDARLAGLHHGHTAANWQEAQTLLPAVDPIAEGLSRAAEQSTYDPEAWAAGFADGWQMREDGLYEDGTPMDDDSDEGQ